MNWKDDRNTQSEENFNNSIKKIDKKDFSSLLYHLYLQN